MIYSAGLNQEALAPCGYPPKLDCNDTRPRSLVNLVVYLHSFFSASLAYRATFPPH